MGRTAEDMTQDWAIGSRRSGVFVVVIRSGDKEYTITSYSITSQQLMEHYFVENQFS
jgi:hypothetical protein